MRIADQFIGDGGELLTIPVRWKSQDEAQWVVQQMAKGINQGDARRAYALMEQRKGKA